ncbi:MAG TPA: SDR family NAD(P)-dependent oxidoreductase [Longimicrobiaceae bacterium]|nr:SDR family NAD(P)-dependent oxidoreductase [Longimicrobiaceae bacterium]
MKPLAGKVAVVAGATRGAGRGIARMLGEAGATVYCTGRSSRHQPNTSGHHYAGRPETIEETAELVEAAGGRGIPVRVDHTVEAEVAGLFERVARGRQRLDVLVNVLTGPPATYGTPFLEQSVEQGRAAFDAWVWPHVTTCRYAVPLMLEGKSGLIVEIIEQESIGYHGEFYFDLYETAMKRLAYALAEELAPKGVTALALTPGFMRTEAILEQFGVTEANWREAAEQNEEAKRYGFIHSETPCFVGRAVAALAADPEVARWSGGVYSSWTLSGEYGFTDLDGTRPNIWPTVAEYFASSYGAPRAAVQWRLVRTPA